MEISEQEYTKLQNRIKELESTEARLAIILEHAPDGYFLSNLKGEFVDGNKKAEEMIGYSREETIGKSFLKMGLLSAGQIPLAAAAVAKNAMGLPSGQVELTLNRKDGKKAHVEVRSHPVKINGETFVLGIARDISERKAAEKALKEKVEELEQFYKSAVGRELKMVELEKEIEKLKAEHDKK